MWKILHDSFFALIQKNNNFCNIDSNHANGFLYEKIYTKIIKINKRRINMFC
jgi:hypothetical protein